MRYRARVEPRPDQATRAAAAEAPKEVIAAADALMRAVRRIENLRVLTSRAVRDINADAERLRSSPGEDNGPIVIRLLESVGERAQTLDDRVKELADALGRATGQLEARPQSSKRRLGASVSRKDSDATAPEPVSEGVRLMALQMAVGGSDREEVEARLRGDFEVEVTDEVLDELFGSVP